MSELPSRGVVFWPVGTGDSTTVVVDDQVVLQIDLHDMAKADDDNNPEVPVVDKLVDALPLDSFALGPSHNGGRRLRVTWTPPRVYENGSDPVPMSIDGRISGL